MSIHQTLTPEETKTTNTFRTILLVLVLGLVIGVVLIWQTVYTSAENVFWGMIRNNLSTNGVTRTVSNEYQGQTYEQVAHVGFGSNPFAHTVVQITQQQNDTKTDVITESIGTRNADYNRYIKIETNEKGKDGQVLNTNQIVGKWGKNEDASTVSGYAQSVQGLVAFANLPTQVRNDVVKRMRTDNIYTVDFSTAKPRKEGKKAAWSYQVEVDVYKFLQVLQLVSQYNDLNKEAAINPDDYKDQGKLQMTMVVDKASRQLLSIEQQGQTQKYSGYGLRNTIALPTDTISQQEFESKLQTLQ